MKEKKREGGVVACCGKKGKDEGKEKEIDTKYGYGIPLTSRV